jgi:ornithine cyclodeaminase/alanine dehydrogenase-like protein (mu-crystallin family)
MVRDDPAGGGNKFVVLVGWQGGSVIAVKMVGVFPDNLTLKPPQPSVQGLVAVFDASTGAPLLAADGAAMTFRKTAADSALGASFLARPDARVLLVVGAGGLAPHVLEAHRAARPSLDRVLVWNRTHHRAEALARSLADRGYAISAVSDLDQAVAEADVISCVTMSDAPLVKGALLKPGAHLDLVGAYLPTMREADDDAMARGSIFVDTRSGMEGAGDLCQPVQHGRIAWSDVRADLFDLCAGRHPGRTSPDEITIYKNVGGGHLDLFTAQCLRAIAGRSA